MSIISGVPEKQCDLCFSFSSFVDIQTEEKGKRDIWADVVCDSCGSITDTVKVGYDMKERKSKPSVCPGCKNSKVYLSDFGESWEEIICERCGFLYRINSSHS